MNILYVLSSCNIYGGTPKKTLDLIGNGDFKSYLYLYENDNLQFKYLFEQAGARVYEGFYKRNLFKHLSCLLRIVDENSINVIHTQFPMGEMICGLVKLFRPKVKLVVSFVGPFDAQRYKFLLNFIYRKVDAFVFVSNYVKSEKLKQYPQIAKPEIKKYVIYNGTNKRCVESGLPKIRFSMLYVGGLTEWKNVSVLIEATYVLVNKYNLDIDLDIIGDGPLKPVLKDMINRFNLGGSITLHGYLSNIGGYLEKADIYLHPAFAEGFGISVAEAMIAGKAVIASKAGAMPELLADKCGILVSPKDVDSWVAAIFKLYNDDSLRTLLADKAKNRAEEYFSIKNYVLSYKNVYREII
ncbi:glycosyltransferase family 4 protein [Shewanella sp. KCT]|uniref:glycosyltransferase family 4 protein n=1 Tax=Shewanella sp. KCT TaxID=2569535 RepID=UPI00118324B7|nr:glycosyltransferase family 4 protein [Shewanella sp. KCT]TVP10594.1 hypothetical protein AYI87_17700 [Shewanella sp. KCT]